MTAVFLGLLGVEGEAHALVGAVELLEHVALLELHGAGATHVILSCFFRREFFPFGFLELADV